MCNSKEVLEQNARFVERLQSGKVNYTWAPTDTSHDEQKELVEQLTREHPSVKVEVERLKDMDKDTLEEVMGKALGV